MNVAHARETPLGFRIVPGARHCYFLARIVATGKKALDFPCGAFGGENSWAFIPAAIEAKALGARTSTVRASEWCST